MPTLYLPKVSTYSVPSGSRPGKAHTVQITERGEAQCSCEDWELHAAPRYRCKHIKAVMTSEKLAPAIIKTHFVYPPIPDRNFDWSATFDSYEPGNLIGYGPTEEAAIADLRGQAEDEKEIQA